MTRYILKRLLLIVPTLFGIITLNFFIVQLAPGGPVDQMIAQMSGEAVGIVYSNPEMSLKQSAIKLLIQAVHGVV